MIEKTEWELVDEPARDAEPGARAASRAMPGPGRWWRWKFAGAALLVSLALILFATAALVAFGLVAAAALLSIAIGKLRRHLGWHTPGAVLHR